MQDGLRGAGVSNRKENPIWTAIHIFSALQWSALVAVSLIELAINGGINRSISDGGQFSPAFTVWFMVIMSATIASSIRAALVETKE